MLYPIYHWHSTPKNTREKNWHIDTSVCECAFDDVIYFIFVWFGSCLTVLFHRIEWLRSAQAQRLAQAFVHTYATRTLTLNTPIYYVWVYVILVCFSLLSAWTLLCAAAARGISCGTRLCTFDIFHSYFSSSKCTLLLLSLSFHSHDAIHSVSVKSTIFACTHHNVLYKIEFYWIAFVMLLHLLFMQCCWLAKGTKMKIEYVSRDGLKSNRKIEQPLKLFRYSTGRKARKKRITKMKSVSFFFFWHLNTHRVLCRSVSAKCSKCSKTFDCSTILLARYRECIGFGFANSMILLLYCCTYRVQCTWAREKNHSNENECAVHTSSAWMRKQFSSGVSRRIRFAWHNRSENMINSLTFSKIWKFSIFSFAKTIPTEPL